MKMFCRNCGNQVADTNAFCGNCGAQSVQQPVQQPVKQLVQQPIQQPVVYYAMQPAQPKSKFPLVGVIASGIVILLIIAAIGGSSGNNSNSSAGVTPAKVHKIGETVTVGVWSYEVTDVHWAKSIGDYPVTQWPDAKFLIVGLVARNNDRTASVLPPLKLVDGANREYDQSSNEIYLEHSFGMLKSVNPGVESSGDILFDVPEGTYKLQLSGGFESGESTTVDLQ
jgi:hypothetical protein